MSARIITVAQQKGGAGKTTLAIHLATAFAQRGYSTILFDTDPQGTASQWHGRRRNKEMGLIATSGWRLSKDLNMARGENDIIIIDSPPHTESEAKEAIRAADLVLMPMQPSPADLWAMQETYDMVKKEDRPCMAVLSRVVARASNAGEIRKKLMMLDIPCAEASFGNRVLFADSMAEGKTVLDCGQNVCADEVNALMREMCMNYLGIELKKAPSQSALGKLLRFRKVS